MEAVTPKSHRHPVIEELLGSLAQRIRGSGPLADFHRVVLGLIYLHEAAPQQLARLTAGSPDQEDPRVLLQRIARLLLAILSDKELPTAITSALSAIRPASRRDVTRLIHLTGELPARQFELFARRLESSSRSGGIKSVTPTTVASLMARLAIHDSIPALVYDPCSRAGELLTSARRHCAGDISCTPESTPRSAPTAPPS